ncbi:hypothetical protein [Bradyrhizobium sp. NAS80.1]|uniref:hypothetical protein n=1 Tax=Bradyrhizobium sp. NAS80.1 TaxID=1680159 RepID=UPI00143D45CC|nr:hypothetical protein [Bradyrhizobium sp. NAS80.1]
MNAYDLRKKGMTLHEIAECLGTSRVEVLRELSDPGKPWRSIVDCASGRANVIPSKEY